MTDKNGGSVPLENAVTRYAAQQGLESRKVGEKLMKTVMPSGAGPEDLVIFMGLAERHGFDPLLGECFAFTAQNGGVRMVISIDGWSSIMNRHPQFDGVEIERVNTDDGKLYAMRGTLHRKDRSHPIVIEEYLDECRRNTGPWKSHPARMLRHKLLGQICRIGLGITDVMDDDEAARHEEAIARRPERATITVESLRAKPDEEPEPAEGSPEGEETLTAEEMDEADRKAGLFDGGDEEDPG